jgi:hypothetical protein
MVTAAPAAAAGVAHLAVVLHQHSRRGFLFVSWRCWCVCVSFEIFFLPVSSARSIYLGQLQLHSTETALSPATNARLPIPPRRARVAWVCAPRARC